MKPDEDNLAPGEKAQAGFPMMHHTLPIYFDELSLSKFIEDYLDYQITYAYDQLESIRSNQQAEQGLTTQTMAPQSPKGGGNDEN